MAASSDPVEIIGIRKTLEQIECCDLILFLVEAHRAIEQEDRRLFEKVQGRPHLIVANKIDLLDPAAAEPDFQNAFDGHPRVAVSALRGDGLGALKNRIVEMVAGDRPLDLDPGVIPNLRHKHLLDKSRETCRSLCTDLEQSAAPEVLALHVGEVLDHAA